ncbi:hypothetical protein ABI582_01175 [Pseudomonas sp. SAS7]|uniref:hypothetical protein n=1 Tax=Pseudomonas sp. SAS7 TaxID=3156487 RepID=UPI003F97879A
MIPVSMPAMLLGYMIYLFSEVFLWLLIACLLALLIPVAGAICWPGVGASAFSWCCWLQAADCMSSSSTSIGRTGVRTIPALSTSKCSVTWCFRPVRGSICKTWSLSTG